MKEKKFITNLIMIRKLFIILLILIIIGIFLIEFQNYFNDPNQISNYIKSFGIFGPIFIILIVTLEVLIAPIPGTIISIASGYAFGGLEGTIYNYLGNIIGNSIAFFLAYKFGRPFVEKLINKKKIKTYDCFLKTKGKYILWIGFLFPVFPTDILSLIAGISKIKYKDFLKIIIIAFIPNMLILNYYGETLFNSGFSFASLYFTLFLIILFLITLLIFIDFNKKNENDCKSI